jgi:phenylalanyl-tRNA synthetase beta chain
MIVSWKWLQEYVGLSMPLEELTERLTISGLNLEGLEKIGADWAIDLEVTSNRPDCLGHVGVAREVAVLWDLPLQLSSPVPQATGPTVEGQTSVTVACPKLCHRYTARVIRGVKIGPSPQWLADRLRVLGIAVINNVVDISNYVMMECGQPLHVFDFSKLSGCQIRVRESLPGESFSAIDHRQYELAAGTCVIADAEKVVALAGVMGGAESEVSATTTDLLIEAADFSPLSVRNTARQHHLHSPSSFRFERGVDWPGIDWASRRCCELILQHAGGELATGMVDVGETPAPRSEIKLRFNQLKRVLGIAVCPDRAREILTALGGRETHACDHCVKVIPPTWRADLSREIDLIEEVARIHGYDKIPEDTSVKLASSARSREDVVWEAVGDTLVAMGFNEAITLSAVPREWIDCFQPWTTADPLVTATPVLRRANCLRQSLVPSLLATRKANESLSNPVIELFEIANVYLPQPEGMPTELRLLSVTSGGGFFELKGVLEGLLQKFVPGLQLVVEPWEDRMFVADRGCRLSIAPENQQGSKQQEATLDEHPWGILGELSSWGLEQFKLRKGTSVAEIDLGPLVNLTQRVRTAGHISPYPAVDRDLNVVVSESVRWAEVERITRTHAGDCLEHIEYRETYRDPGRLGEGKKSLLFTIQLRSTEATLTRAQADQVRSQIVAALDQELGGQLRE